MLAKTYGCAVHGVEARKITVEVNVGQGLRFHMSGLPDNAVKESEHRVESAVKQFKYFMPREKTVINLAPADIRKEGSAYDLPIALCILRASGQIQTERLQTLSEETGGRIYLVGDLADLAGEYSKVAHELRNTFSLTYYSKNQWNDGVMRKIRVEVKDPRYRVHSRTTYYVPKIE